MPHRFDKESPQKIRSGKTEKKLAKRLDAKPQPGSGAISGHKGDLKSLKYLYEVKQTDAKSFSISFVILHKLMREADGAGREPVLIVQFDSATAIEKQWAVMPLSQFERLKT